jgi:predicted DNA-binding protein with PD1-like motif
MIHAHTVVGKRDGTAHGGHVLKAHVDPTLEVFLIESPSDLKRKKDERSGLALICIDDLSKK